VRLPRTRVRELVLLKLDHRIGVPGLHQGPSCRILALGRHVRPAAVLQDSSGRAVCRSIEHLVAVLSALPRLFGADPHRRGLHADLVGLAAPGTARIYAAPRNEGKCARLITLGEKLGHSCLNGMQVPEWHVKFVAVPCEQRMVAIRQCGLLHCSMTPTL
jgi:hypothetical protein